MNSVQGKSFSKVIRLARLPEANIYLCILQRSKHYHYFFKVSFFSELVVISSDEEDPGAEGGDEYEGDRDSDSEIDEEDLWACSQCNLKNHPMSRQCARCWSERHEWLPHLKRQVYFAVDSNHFMSSSMFILKKCFLTGSIHLTYK